MITLPNRIWTHTSDKEFVEIDRHGNKRTVVKKMYSSSPRTGEKRVYPTLWDYLKENHPEVQTRRAEAA